MGEIPGYGGRLDRCSGCGRPFQRREIIRVDVMIPAAFCAATIDDCVAAWQQKIGQPSAVHQAEEMRFHGNT